MQTSIAKLRRHVAQLQEWNRGKLSKNRVKADLERKYYVKNKDLNVVIEKMKQRIKAETSKRQRYDERNNQFVQNRLFRTNQNFLFGKIEKKSRQNDVKTNAESRTFWSDIWSQNAEDNEGAEWINEVKKKV